MPAVPNFPYRDRWSMIRFNIEELYWERMNDELETMEYAILLTMDLYDRFQAGDREGFELLTYVHCLTYNWSPNKFETGHPWKRQTVHIERHPLEVIADAVGDKYDFEAQYGCLMGVSEPYVIFEPKLSPFMYRKDVDWVEARFIAKHATFQCPDCGHGRLCRVDDCFVCARCKGDNVIFDCRDVLMLHDGMSVKKMKTVKISLDEYFAGRD